jgi:hypothetical protein
MSKIKAILEELDEVYIARNIANRHDETRMQYSLQTNTVDNFAEYSDIIGDYLNYHVSRCVTPGGRFSRDEAASRAKEIIEKEYHQSHRGDLMNAFQDAKTGMNSGLRGQLDLISEYLKSESINRHTREVFARYVDPSSWEERVSIIRDFIDHCGVDLGSAIDADHPERYARNYEELIISYNYALQRTSSIFRRL